MCLHGETAGGTGWNRMRVCLTNAPPLPAAAVRTAGPFSGESVTGPQQLVVVRWLLNITVCHLNIQDPLPTLHRADLGVTAVRLCVVKFQRIPVHIVAQEIDGRRQLVPFMVYNRLQLLTGATVYETLRSSQEALNRLRCQRGRGPLYLREWLRIQAIQATSHALRGRNRLRMLIDLDRRLGDDILWQECMGIASTQSVIGTHHALPFLSIGRPEERAIALPFPTTRQRYELD